jgi:parallel beta-helix repeat protein
MGGEKMSEKRFRKLLPLFTTLALILPLLFALAAPVSAATLDVSKDDPGCDDGIGDPYCTIQAAVSDANHGDVIHVYPAATPYAEGVNISAMNPHGDITIVAVDANGIPTPGAVTVDNPGDDSEFYTSSPFDGDITIDGFNLHSLYGAIEVWVDGSDTVVRHVEIRNVNASGTGGDGILVWADGDVTITNCTANDNNGTGIMVEGARNVTLTDCTANGNGGAHGSPGSGIYVFNVSGAVEISNCTANQNTCTVAGAGSRSIAVTCGHGINVNAAPGPVDIFNSTANQNELSGIWILQTDGDVTISNCTVIGNGIFGVDVSLSGHSPSLHINASVIRENDTGIQLGDLSLDGEAWVEGSIICDNTSDGLVVGGDANDTVNAQGNWWGCPDGPDDPACDDVTWGPATVYIGPWIDTITARAPASAMVGEPTPVTFQFSGGDGTIFLGEGPGDLRGPPTFVVTTDNGTVLDPGFINEPDGVLAAVLVPGTPGTATVTLMGPCGLEDSIDIEVEQPPPPEDFVPEPGSVMLLASGLMGLAGYAGLRLRKK